MANQHGDFIWYELMTKDPQAAKVFYEDVVGWKVVAEGMAVDSYPKISAGDNDVGGVLTLTDEMCQHGARATWIAYAGVDDVDDTVGRVEELGGTILMPAQDIPQVGRFAMVADPQHIPFYIMRGAMDDEVSAAFSPTALGHCSWNELCTPDQDAAIAFYGSLFGWKNKESMPIGEGAEYKFLHHHESMIGAVSPCNDPQQEMGWTFYFRVADIDKAAEKINKRGGKVQFGPHEVPGGDYIVIGRDPEGVTFGLTGQKLLT